jgi:oxygen-dependent protoporphyrinogen oxidase
LTKIWDAVVVGGGLSGLISAWELGKSGNSVLLLEASSSLGGAIAATALAGHMVDSGAEAFSVASDSALDLIEELGLTEKIVEPARSDARIINQGKMFQIPHGLMGIPSKLTDPEVELILGTEERDLAQKLDAAPWNITTESSLGEIVEKRMGRAVVEKIVNPITAGVHASNSYLLEMDSILPGVLELAAAKGSLELAVREIRNTSGRPGSAVRGLDGGIFQIIDELEKQLGNYQVKIRVEQQVQQVEFDAANGYWVTFINTERVLSRKLVLAVPAHKAALILTQHPEIADQLLSIKAVDVAVVILAVKSKELDSEPLGSGVLVVEDQGEIKAKASTHATAKWGWLKELYGNDVEIIRFSYGRDGFLPEDLSQLLDFAEADLRWLYGLTNFEILDSVLAPWRGVLVQSTIGHRVRLQKISELVNVQVGLAVVGAGMGGNGIIGTIKKTKESIARLEKEYIDHD